VTTSPSTIDRVLEQWAGEPVLVDVGASGGAPAMWLPLAGHSWYVAFDPDQREMAHASGEGPFKRKTVVNEAITPDPNSSEVRFFLTRSPFCSSTLRPDATLVANYFKAERFEVLSETTARAATLGNVLERIGATRLDWLKLDTQGTDRRIYASLPESIRNTMLAVDLEPGLRGAYVNEDLMGDVHAALLKDGFWLSDMQVKGPVRMRQSSLDDLHQRCPEIDVGFIERSVRHTPGWTELRYVRSIESVHEHGGDRREFALLWAIATIDAQHGFALDVVGHWEKHFGADATSTLMRDESVSQIRATHIRRQQKAKRGLRQRLRSIVKRFVPGAPRKPASTAPAVAPKLSVSANP
jgi:FkbM family methyltransferase